MQKDYDEPNKLAPIIDFFKKTLAEVNNSIQIKLNNLMIEVEKLKKTSIFSLQAIEIKTKLEDLLHDLKEIPHGHDNETKNDTIKILKSYLSANSFINDFKSLAANQRHWKQLMNKMNVQMNLNDLTLGHLWDINLIVYKPIINDMVKVAEGEKAIEEFLKKVSELWNNPSTLELINYQNKCKIIRGWDNLFNNLIEHINR